jgi:hypothetical protein
MGVVNWSEVVAGTSVSGKFGESTRLTRKFTIRTDSLLTPKGWITYAPGVNWGDPHPDAPVCKAMEFELANSDDVGLRWLMTITYYVPPPQKKVKSDGSNVPEDYWEATGGTRVVPCFTDTDGETITNSAGDPLEGLEREASEFGWTLTKFYTDDTWKEDAASASNTVNSDEWDDKDPGTWKVEFKGAKLREITPTGSPEEGEGQDPVTACVETRWEFRYDESGWKALPWDVGFMELSGSGEKKVITTADGRPVKQPVALNGDGKAKTPGEKPEIINGGDGAEIYKQTAFGDLFGEPFIYPQDEGF